MILQFLKVSFRQFKIQPFVNGLSLLGIAIGLAGVIVLSIIVKQEYSFDRFHSDADKIYRLTTHFRIDGRETSYAVNEGIFDDVLVKSVPNVEMSTVFFGANNPVPMYVGEKMFVEPNGFFVDNDFLNVFSFKFIGGVNGLNDPNTIALTKRLALKLFGTTDVTGRELEMGSGTGKLPLRVVAVLEDIPLNSTITFDFLISGTTFGDVWNKILTVNDGSSQFLRIFFKLREEQPIEELQAAVDTAFSTYKMKSANYRMNTPVQPLTDIHFNARNQFELRPGANPDAFRIYVALIGSIMIIITLNASNINSARLLKQVKAVGAGRLFGATRANIFLMCMIDIALQNLVAFSIAAALAVFIVLKIDLSMFSIDESTPIVFITSGSFLLFYLAYSFVTGFYPVMKVSSFAVQRSLTGKVDPGRQGIFGLRYVLVTLQVVAASTMVVFSVTIVRQIGHVTQMDLGYSRENIIQFKAPMNASAGDINAFKNKLAEQSVFTSVGTCYTDLLGLDGMATTRLMNRDHEGLMMAWNKVDGGFIPTMKMDLVEGRGFHMDGSDSLSVIINESTRDILKVGVGDELMYYPKWLKIVAVVKDFNFRGFDEGISPAIFFCSQDMNIILAKFREGKGDEALNASKAAWHQTFDSPDVSYGFFSDSFDKLVSKEFQTAYIAIFFSIVTLCIACIGVLGLTAHITFNYTKVIAIRKIMGASTGDILRQLGNRFVIIALAGSLLAVPLSIWLATYWLSHFQYKTPLVFTDFFLTFVLMLALIVVVVFRQVYRSSSANPVDAIRTE